MKQNNIKKKKRIGFRLNIVDFVIIIAVIACGVGVYIRYTIGLEMENAPINLVDAKAEFLLVDVSEQLADSLTAGSPVYIGDKTPIGELSAIFSKLPSERFIATMDGTVVKTYSDEFRFDVRGAITLKGTMTDKGFLYEGKTFIAPGSYINIQTPEADLSLYIMNITLEE